MGRREILFLEDDGDQGTGRQGKGRFMGILRKLQALFCVMAEGSLAGGALYGKKLDAAVLGLLVVAQIALWVLLHWKSGRTLGKRRGAGYGREKSVPIGISLCAVLFVALAAVLFRPAAYYEAVYRAEGHITALFRDLGGGKGLSSSGKINRGNQYRTGDVQLELTASEVPTESLYLRGFAGGDYVGNGWEAADEEALFHEVADILDWEEWIGMIGGMYDTMYFVLNFDMAEGGLERELHITHPDGDYSNVYIPYYSRSRWSWRGRGGARKRDMSVNTMRGKTWASHGRGRRA